MTRGLGWALPVIWMCCAAGGGLGVGVANAAELKVGETVIVPSGVEVWQVPDGKCGNAYSVEFKNHIETYWSTKSTSEAVVVKVIECGSDYPKAVDGTGRYPGKKPGGTLSWYQERPEIKRLVVVRDRTDGLLMIVADTTLL